MTTPAPVDGIVALLAELVRTPSRASVDDLAAVAQVMQRWFARQDLPHRLLQGADGRVLGLYAELKGARPGPWVVLDATLDTADFGDEGRWSHPPTSAVVADGWLHGRGSADSKAGAALFAHLLAAWAQHDVDRWGGTLGVLFDLDEHSGGFGGARAFFDAAPRPDVVVIGYPGDDSIVTGGRGFVRARLQVAGVAAHSGAATDRGVNAVQRASSLAQQLAALPLGGTDPLLGLPPQLTLVGLQGGGPGYSQVPDAAELRIDLRLTTRFDDAAARRTVAQAVARHDSGWPQAAPTRIDWLPGWPAYRVADDHFMVQALRQASADEQGAPLPTQVVGPSNIGNYLAALGVPALCGFGVRGQGIHASNERVCIASIAPVWRIYQGALQRVLR